MIITTTPLNYFASLDAFLQSHYNLIHSNFQILNDVRNPMTPSLLTKQAQSHKKAQTVIWDYFIRLSSFYGIVHQNEYNPLGKITRVH